MPRHKRSESDIQAPWVDVPAPSAEAQTQALFSPCSLNHSSPGLARSGKTGGASRESSLALNGSCLLPSQGSDDAPSTSHEALMHYRGVRVKVKATATHISWKPVNAHSACCLDRRTLTQKIPFDEILSAWTLPKPAVCCCPREHAFVVYAVLRSARDPNTWRVQEHVLAAPSPEQLKEWVGLVNGAVGSIRDRPRNLLVFINPFSGAKRARLVWEHDVLPVFQKARIKFNVVETSKQDHAKDYMSTIKAEELAAYQGVVAIGGDGMFQEVTCGLLAQRARGGDNAAASHRIRIGHVPAGSTDAVSYSMHGSRCAVTAALHIALGDRLALDVGRVDATPAPHTAPGDAAAAAGGAPPPLLPAGCFSPSAAAAPGAGCSWKHFVCQAGYGFMGDVMRHSEKLRCMGPSRYDVMGALQFLRLASYRCSLAFREAPSTLADVQQLCTVKCEVCRMAGLCMDSVGFGRGSGNSSHSSAHNSSQYHQQQQLGGSSPRAQLKHGAPRPSLDLEPPTPAAAGQPGNGGSAVAGQQQQQGSGPASLQHAGSGLQRQQSNTALLGGGGGGPAASSAAVSTQASGALCVVGVGAGSHKALGGSPSHHHVAQQGGPNDSSEGGCGAGSGGSSGPAGGAGGASAGGGGRPAGASSGEKAAGGGGGGGALHLVKGEDGWTRCEGEFASIMCVVTPCRSDKSKKGIIPNGHLSDGRMYLVLVSKCGHLNYLRFLIRLSTRGLVDRCLPFVRVIPVSELHLRPLEGGHTGGGCFGQGGGGGDGGGSGDRFESCWNVDGELMRDNHVRIRVARGAVDVFARGVDTGASR